MTTNKRTLGYDTARCAGRYDFDPVGGWCPERDTCQRYLAFVHWDREAGIEDYRRIPVNTASQDCKHKIEVKHG